MLERSRARRQALHILYQREITGETVEKILNTRSFNLEEGEPNDFCRSVVAGIQEHQAEIDVTIDRISENWVVSRMPLVDLNILRLAVYEILFVDEVPDSVAINEAVELAKNYGGDDSSKFVNGVLGRVAEEHVGAEEGTDGSDD